MKADTERIAAMTHGLTLKQQQLCQRIQDEQGFLIIASRDWYGIGTLLKAASFPTLKGAARLPPIRVIGHTTKARYRRQHERYAPKENGPFVDLPYKLYFHKVVAE